jgi:hypothetical protein
MVRRKAQDLEAVSWALSEAESQLRNEPAHWLRDSDRALSWSFDAPNGVGVYVEAIRTAVTDTAVTVTLSGGAAGWFNPHRLEREVSLPLTGDAARLPALPYLVFEKAACMPLRAWRRPGTP